MPMKTHAWDLDFGARFHPRPAPPGRRKTVKQILREAYRKHVHDRLTKQALKRCLR
jgi:hypothetical protein